MMMMGSCIEVVPFAESRRHLLNRNTEVLLA